MNVPSEKLKFVNAVIPVADAFDTATQSDFINMENYRKCTFIIATGASAAADGVITVQAGVSNAACATAIVFKYRTQIGAIPPAALSDVPGALTAAGVGGFVMTQSKGGGLYIIEVDAAVVAAGITNGDHCAITITEDSNVPQTACVLAILSEPRYPQDVLATAID